jgi:hypothetical protein
MTVDSRTLYDDVLRLLDDAGWKFQPTEEYLSATMIMEGQHGTWPCVVMVREDARQIITYSANTLRVPADRRAKLAELIARANFGMAIGNFELNVDTGEIRYKTSVDVSASTLDAGLLERLIRANIETMDRYLPALRAASDSETSAVNALTQVDR